MAPQETNDYVLSRLRAERDKKAAPVMLIPSNAAVVLSSGTF